MKTTFKYVLSLFSVVFLLGFTVPDELPQLPSDSVLMETRDWYCDDGHIVTSRRFESKNELDEGGVVYWAEGELVFAVAAFNPELIAVFILHPDNTVVVITGGDLRFLEDPCDTALRFRIKRGLKDI